MAYFLTNLKETSSVIFKNGQIEIAPGASKRIGESDLKSGIFDDFISHGIVSVSESDVIPTPLFEHKEIVAENIKQSDSLTEAEMKEHLKNKKDKSSESIGARVVPLGQE